MSVNISSIQLLHDVLSFRFSHACPQRYLFDSAPTPNAHALHKLTDFDARCQHQSTSSSSSSGGGVYSSMRPVSLVYSSEHAGPVSPA